MTGFLQGLENEGAVGGKVVLATPGAMFDEISKDWHDGTFLRNNAIGAAVGFATTLAAKEVPVLAVALGIGFAGYEGYKLISGGVSLAGKAWSAGSSQQRDALAGTYAQAFSHNATPLIESLPGFALGGAAGSLAYTPLKEAIAFNASGSMRLPADAFNADGTVNALKVTDTVSEPWQGVERMRSIDLDSGKISRPVAGEETTVTPAFADKSGRILFHTHAPQYGVVPSAMDTAGTADLGIIQSGAERGFYIGQKGIQPGDMSLKALLVDPEKQLAVRLETTIDPASLTGGTTVKNPTALRWLYPTSTLVDYKSAAEALQALDLKNPWAQIGSIPAIAPKQVPVVLYEH